VTGNFFALMSDLVAFYQIVKRFNP
jgi:hypothetical protein